MLMTHGLEKLGNFIELSFTFPDPMGVGKTLSLSLVIFGELCCSLAFILGFLYRLCMIPMIIVMSTAFFYIHEGSIGNGELAFIYLIVLVLMYIEVPANTLTMQLFTTACIKKKLNTTTFDLQFTEFSI
jgi:putative oxidoreductase